MHVECTLRTVNESRLRFCAGKCCIVALLGVRSRLRLWILASGKRAWCVVGLGQCWPLIASRKPSLLGPCFTILFTGRHMSAAVSDQHMQSSSDLAEQSLTSSASSFFS